MTPDVLPLAPCAIDERFIFHGKFKDKLGHTKKVRMLNADGHVDYAHQKGLVSLTTEYTRWTEGDKDNLTRWCIAKATAIVMSDKGGTVTATGISCVSDRDRFVKDAGREVEVAETRAKKRALADAANITEKVITPEGKEPARETVDTPLDDGGEVEEPSNEIPAGIRKTIAPVITAPDGLVAQDQFQI